MNARAVDGDGVAALRYSARVSSASLAALRAFCDTSLEDHFAAHARVDPAARALELFRRAAAEVPAYRAFLRDAGIEPANARALSEVPTVSKESYLRAHALAELCFAGELSGCDTVAVSSGSTGVPTYFPRALRHEVGVAWRFEQVFRDSFGAHEGRTLALVCFPLGTWVGGMFTTACCRQLALKGYPLMVATPGNQPPEILRALRELAPLHDRVVLLGYPPFLKDVIDGALAEGVELRRRPLLLVLAGEVVSEEWRDIMGERTGTVDPLHGSASLYGTADAGVLGNETPLSVAIRRFLASHGDVAEEIFGTRRLPTLVQYDPVDRYFEEEGGALVFTGEGGGIPLVRYAIGDSGGVLGFHAMLAKLAPHGFRAPELARRELPFVWVFGRAQHAVSFYGANVFAETVRVGLEAAAVRASVSGKFVMEAAEDAAGDRHLVVDVELARGVAPSATLRQYVAESIRAALVAVGGEFAAYVPPARQLPEVALWAHAHPQHFPTGVKHRYVRP
jgi:phenylacetate-CoA ligase